MFGREACWLSWANSGQCWLFAVFSVGMAPIRPEDLSLSAVARGPFGQLRAGAVEKLLQRAAWDYGEALAENQRLARRVEELSQRVEELTAQVASLEGESVRRRDSDELARTLIASAQRAAREERESARREAELLLKKAARRASRVEEGVDRLEADRRLELARLEALRGDVVVRLRGTLETMVGRCRQARNGDQAVGSPGQR
jgi:cell division septum initiation protein DivIVA